MSDALSSQCRQAQHEERLRTDRHYRLICYLSGNPMPDEFLPLDPRQEAREVYGQQGCRKRLERLQARIQQLRDETVLQMYAHCTSPYAALVIEDMAWRPLTIAELEMLAVEDAVERK